jgi:uncharacterized membrane protein YedE/YeeE
VRVKLAALAVGAVFGATLSWTGMSSPEVIRDALLFRSAYLFLFFASAVATAFVGLRLLCARRERAILVDKPVRWATQRPQRRHIVGSLIFGTGWAIADACPGPIATQLGQGVGWSVFTTAGLVTGISLYLRRQRLPAEGGEQVRAGGAEAAPART